MRATVKICICAVVAAALIAALCFLLIPSTRWELPDVLNLGNIGDRYEEESSYRVGAETVTEKIDSLEIHWASGKINITTHAGSDILMSESGYTNERQQLRWRVKDGKLTIREYASGLNWSLANKTLELSLPEGGYDELSVDVASAEVTLGGKLSIDELEMDSASGTLTADGITARKISVDSASGDCKLTGCTAESFDMDTASGNAILTGSYDTVELDSASGDLELRTDTAPSKIETDLVSGKVKLYLPADAQFQAELSSLSGDLNVEDFVGSYSDDWFTAGDGSARYSFGSVSGDVDIYQNN